MLIGHQKIIEFLNKSRANNRLAHAYLFVGQEHLGKRALTLEFAKMLQCEISALENNELRTDTEIANHKISPSEENFIRQSSSLVPPHLRDTVPARQIERSQSRHLSFFNFCETCTSCQEINRNAHPDVLLVEPEVVIDKEKTKEKEIGIEKIREIQQKIGLFSFRGKHKIIIIDQAERMTRQAANALLKNLEEPSAKTIFILISSAPQALLPTIISRCLTIKFPAVKKEEIEEGIINIIKEKISKGKTNRVVKLSGNRPGMAINYLRDPELLINQEEIISELETIFKKDLSYRFKFAENLSKDSVKAKQTIDAWLIFFRDLMLKKAECDNLLVWDENQKKEKNKWDSISIEGLKNIINKIISTKKILSNSSFNARLALEVLMLNL